MDPRRAACLVADVHRHAPVVAFGGALMLGLPALIGMFRHAVSATSALERLLVSFVFALIASQLVVMVLVRYAEDIIRRHEESIMGDESPAQSATNE